nr:MAG: hypothetical protein [Rhabdoviridae sp.]
MRYYLFLITFVNYAYGQNVGPLYPFPLPNLQNCPSLYSYVSGLFKVNMWDLEINSNSILIKHSTISIEQSAIGLELDPVLFTMWQYISHVGCLSAFSRKGLHLPYRSSIRKYCINHLEDPIYRYNPLSRTHDHNFKREKALIPSISYNIIHPKSEIKPSIASIVIIGEMPCYNYNFTKTWTIDTSSAYDAIKKEIPYPIPDKDHSGPDNSSITTTNIPTLPPITQDTISNKTTSLITTQHSSPTLTSISTITLNPSTNTRTVPTQKDTTKKELTSKTYTPITSDITTTKGESNPSISTKDTLSPVTQQEDTGDASHQTQKPAISTTGTSSHQDDHPETTIMSTIVFEAPLSTFLTTSFLS